MIHEETDVLQLGHVTLKSRLLVGTGKYASLDETAQCLRESGSEMVTVAIRRVEPPQPGQKSLWDVIPSNMHILPNTAGCYTVEDCCERHALLASYWARSGALVKVEVIGDPDTLFPDVTATIEATEALVKEGFVCLPYITDDPVACKEYRCGRNGRHAIGCAHRLWIGDPKPIQPSNHFGAGPASSGRARDR